MSEKVQKQKSKMTIKIVCKTFNLSTVVWVKSGRSHRIDLVRITPWYGTVGRSVSNVKMRENKNYNIQKAGSQDGGSLETLKNFRIPIQWNFYVQRTPERPFFSIWKTPNMNLPYIYEVVRLKLLFLALAGWEKGNFSRKLSKPIIMVSTQKKTF